jgi:hypothetical protein
MVPDVDLQFLKYSVRNKQNKINPAVTDRWEDNIKTGEVGWGAWIGLIWLRLGTGGGLL